MRFISLLARLVLGGVFLAAAVPKIADPAAFAQSVYNYQLLPDALVNILALVLPWLELALGVALILGRFMLGASGLALVLLAVFLGAMGYNVARGLDIACGCFSAAPDPDANLTHSVIRDVGIFLLALMVFVRSALGTRTIRS